MKKENNDLISIIVPVYNQEKNIKKCLDSLINQTYKNIEIILINDGSSDDSEKIINTYKDKRIRYFKNENQGIGKTRNFGIDKSVGKYIIFVDSDDYVDLKMCELLYKKISSDDLDLVVCNFYRDIDSSLIEEKLESFPNTSLKDTPSLLNIINPSPWNKIYKSNIIKDNKIRFVENKKYEDTPFFAKILKYSNKIGKIDEYLYYYVIHKNSETTIRDRRCFDIFDILDMVKDVFSEDEYIKEELNKFIVFVVTNYTIQQRVQEDKQIVSEFINKAFTYLKENVPDYKNKKYYNNKGFARRKIESNKFLTKTYCKTSRIKYRKK